MAKELTWAEALKDAGDLESQHVESTPNGQIYGNNGHVPCDHVAVFTYKKAIIRLSNVSDRLVLSKEAR